MNTQAENKKAYNHLYKFFLRFKFFWMIISIFMLKGKISIFTFFFNLNECVSYIKVLVIFNVIYIWLFNILWSKLYIFWFLKISLKKVDIFTASFNENLHNFLVTGLHFKIYLVVFNQPKDFQISSK